MPTESFWNGAAFAVVLIGIGFALGFPILMGGIANYLSFKGQNTKKPLDD